MRLDELPQSDGRRLVEPRGRLASVGDIAQHQLAPMPRLLSSELPNFAQCQSSCSAQLNIKRTYARRLNSQHEAGQSAIADLEWFVFRLSSGACQQSRSDDRTHTKPSKS